jgi:hypothetical protein
MTDEPCYCPICFSSNTTAGRSMMRGCESRAGGLNQRFLTLLRNVKCDGDDQLHGQWPLDLVDVSGYLLAPDRCT